MSKESMNNNEVNSTIDRVVQILLIIIIIILLLHNCSLMNREDKNSGKNNIIDINNGNGEQVDANSIDCMKDTKNSMCLVPDFRGKTKNELLKWLSTISNTIEIEIKLVDDSNYKDGTIISQSIVGKSVEDLLQEKTKLVVTIVNNGYLVDCENNSENSKCLLLDFTNKTSSDVDNWINGIANYVNIKYVYIESDKPLGTIISQTIKDGTLVKDIIDNNQTLILYVSKGKNLLNPTTSIDTYINNHNNTDNKSKTDNKGKTDKQGELTPSKETENNFFVSDNKIIKWKNEKNLNILEDSSNISKVRGKIAPESSGTYKFIVNNSTKYSLKYSISFTENNQHNMNMKYKLKKGNTYIVDQYVSYEELNIDNMMLNSKSSDTYYLEWKWVGDNDSNDTNIGKNATSENIKYNLKIDVEAESV